MTRIRKLREPERVYRELMDLILRLGQCGLIHGDFNEYNLICSEDEQITLIDFPQMISTDHANARMYFERDCQGVVEFFVKKLGFFGGVVPSFEDVGGRELVLDQEVEASGFTKDKAENFGLLMEALEEEQEGDDDCIEANNDGAVPEESSAKRLPSGEDSSRSHDNVVELKSLEVEDGSMAADEVPTSFLDLAVHSSSAARLEGSDGDGHSEAGKPLLAAASKPEAPIANGRIISGDINIAEELTESEIRAKVRERCKGRRKARQIRARAGIKTRVG